MEIKHFCLDFISIFVAAGRDRSRQAPKFTTAIRPRPGVGSAAPNRGQGMCSHSFDASISHMATRRKRRPGKNRRRPAEGSPGQRGALTSSANRGRAAFVFSGRTSQPHGSFGAAYGPQCKKWPVMLSTRTESPRGRVNYMGIKAFKQNFISIFVAAVCEDCRHTEYKSASAFFLRQKIGHFLGWYGTKVGALAVFQRGHTSPFTVRVVQYLCCGCENIVRAFYIRQQMKKTQPSK